MKISWTILITLMATEVSAQPGGIYATAADFAANRFVYAFDCNSQKGTKVIEFTSRPFLVVKNKEEKKQFNKAEIFGYRECDSTAFRVVGNDIYKILNNNSILLYEEEWVRNKSVEKDRAYFFSKTPSDQLMPLTHAWLKKSYPKDHTFHDQLDAIFKNDHDLIKKDYGTDQFTLIRVFLQTTTK